MSRGLVQRWRRLALQWGDAAANRELRGGSAAELAEYRTRAQVYRQCADSLQRSLDLALKRAARLARDAANRKGKK